MKKLKKIFDTKSYMILPIVTLLCFAGFIGSIVFPNKVLDTYKVNITEEDGDEAFLIPLSTDGGIVYQMNTSGQLQGDRPMKGIQVGVSKLGNEQRGSILNYCVYVNEKDGSMTLVSENVYEIEEGLDYQFVYLPFKDYEKCKGDIYITFSHQEGEEHQTVALAANHTLIEDTATIVDGWILDGSLKVSYIYTHNTYPFLFDFRILAFVSLAASMTIAYPKRKRGVSRHEMVQ